MNNYHAGYSGSSVFSEAYTETSLTHDKTKKSLAKRIKALVVGAVLSSVVVGSFYFLSEQRVFKVGSFKVDVSTPAEENALYPAGLMLPANTKVFYQSLMSYHWHQECPLADGVSQRWGKKVAATKRRYMSRSEAEERGWTPCVHCFELER